MERTVDNTVHASSAKQHRFHLLDAIRGIAALLVVAYHAPVDFGRLVPFRSGFLAVDLFFALSGFVIAFSYERRLQESLSYGNFIVARVIRLCPVYFLGTFLSAAVGIATSRTLSSHALPIELLLGLSMVPDLFHGSKAALYPLDFPAWSLLCELLSNVVYGGLVLGRIAGRWMLYLLMAASAVFMIAWAHGAGTVDSGSVPATLLMGLARVGYSFGAGVIVFWIYRSRHHERLTGAASWALSVAICLVIFMALATRATQSAGVQLLTVLFGFPVLIYFGSRTSTTGIAGRVAAFLGDISYPIYLLHIPFFTLFRGRSMHRFAERRPEARSAVALMAIAFLMLLSWLAAKYFDAPARRWITTRYNRRIQHATA